MYSFFGRKISKIIGEKFLSCDMAELELGGPGLRTRIIISGTGSKGAGAILAGRLHF